MPPCWETPLKGTLDHCEVFYHICESQIPQGAESLYDVLHPWTCVTNIRYRTLNIYLQIRIWTRMWLVLGVSAVSFLTRTGHRRRLVTVTLRVFPSSFSLFITGIRLLFTIPEPMSQIICDKSLNLYSHILTCSRLMSPSVLGLATMNRNH